VPRARLTTPEGKTAEWKSQALRVYQRRTLAADALIASSYLAGANTRRVRRALAALFAGTVGKDTVSRVWRKVKSDWDVARCHHGFAGCPFAESGKAAGAGPVRGLHVPVEPGHRAGRQRCFARQRRVRQVPTKLFP
jgi:hypothetical protein